MEQILSLRLPRYTSYPTANHFQSQEINKLDFISQIRSPFSLYLHIPFCKKLCYFCACNTKITQEESPIIQYFEYLMKEVKLTYENLSSYDISHLHFGGGTPTVLHESQFATLMEYVHTNLKPQKNSEFAIEIDPRAVTESKIKLYKKYGINRVSFGIQDLNPKVQKYINRVQPFDMNMKVMEWSRNAGIEKINIDLIYGLPHQTVETFQKTIEECLQFNPSRWSIFGYAHVPWMKPHQKQFDESFIPDNNLRYQLFTTAQNILFENGYVQIGIDHFVKKDDMMHKAWQKRQLSRNFQGYTIDDSNILIGLGASSISSFKNAYIQNVNSISKYKHALNVNQIATEKSIRMSYEDQIRQAIISDIMCYGEVEIPYSEMDKYLFRSDLLNDLLDQGFIEITSTKIQIKKHTHLLSRYVSSLFDTYYNQAQQAHSYAS